MSVETALEPILLDAVLSIEQYDLEVSLSTETYNVDVDTKIQVLSQPYEGPYSVTPGDDAITLETSGKSMTENVVVGAIPSNYGKITWNGIGTAITVS